MLPPDFGFEPPPLLDPPLPGGEIPPLGLTGVVGAGALAWAGGVLGAVLGVGADGLGVAAGVVWTVGATERGALDAAGALALRLRAPRVPVGVGAATATCTSIEVGAALLRWLGIAAPAVATVNPGTCSGALAGRSWRPIR